MENKSHILSPLKLKNLANAWLEEDCPSFDIGAFVLGDRTGTANLNCKSPCVLAGVPFFNAIFNALNCCVTWNYDEGEVFGNPDGPFSPVKVATVEGKVRDILRGERPALNVMSRSSGIAKQCQIFTEKAKKCGWKGRIAGTRKTTPGFRIVEKYALMVGGADTHRYDLSSTIMLKDNHIWSTGDITKTVQKALSIASFTTKVEVECRTLAEGLEAAEAGVHIVMFDNFNSKELHSAAKILKKKHPSTIIECSGGITEDNITDFFDENVDVFSTSKLVQGYLCADFSLKIIGVKDALQTP